MVLKNVLTAFVCAALLAWSGVATADEYRPDQFLGLDLPSAVLSPKPLGPSSTFAPAPAEANADHKADRSGEGAQARAEPKAAPRVAPDCSNPEQKCCQDSGRNSSLRRDRREVSGPVSMDPPPGAARSV